eukprot:CAMPEP_0196775896 /NCGR_PEP_ID=MMETSP1104-20130614/4301_1 /TAXON_ID=33652 /ORGANISM="Cafeteria sp., Strain Caron Lab Isolate" /LENGTH=229 /DNA_ID=CAMNT_0042146067 /DNA_START=24 /DNA_END=709 /DNA_ORIENTATION=-
MNKAAVYAKDHLGRTPLHWVAKGKSQQHIECASKLLASSADINAQDNNGNTALHLAAARGFSDMCHFLVGQSADVMVCNKQNDTAFDVAMRCGQLQSALAVRWPNAQAFAWSSIRRRKFRSLLHYLGNCGLALVLVVLITAMVSESYLSADAYFLNAQLRDRLLEEEFPGIEIKKVFRDIGEVTELWDFLEGPLVEFLDSENWRTERSSHPASRTVHGHVWIVGPARLR